jgi:hypothetical protein
MENRKAFNFYRSYYETGLLLDNEDRIEYYDAILHYQFTGEKKEPKREKARLLFRGQIHSLDKQVIGYSKGIETYPNGNPTKGSNKGKYKGAYKQEKEQDKEKDKVQVKVGKSKHLFSDSIYIDKHKFKEVLSDWNTDKLKYYYESLLTWSNEGNKKVDWIATAKQWASRDEREGKVKFESKSTLPANWMQLKLSEDQKKQLTKQELGKYETHQARLSMQ